MGKLVTRTAVVATTGSAGSATGSTTVQVPDGIARLIGAELDFNGMPGTTDVTFATSLGAGSRTIATLTDGNTDRAVLFGHQLIDAAGAAISGRYEPPVVHRSVTVTVAQGDANSSALSVVLIFAVD